MSEPRRLLTVRDVAELLQVSRSSVCRLANAGEIGYHRVGRSMRFRQEQVDAFLDATESVVDVEDRAAHRAASAERRFRPLTEVEKTYPHLQSPRRREAG